MSELTRDNPFAAIFKKAAARPVEGVLSERQRALDRRMKNASQEVFILCDISSSMASAVKDTTKIKMLEIALRDMANNYPTIRVVYFNSYVKEGMANDQLVPFGGTALHKGLEYVERFKPARTIIVSDGQPDSEERAEDVAKRMTGTIDIIYCGPETDTHAFLFLESLAKEAGGQSIQWDMAAPMLQAPIMRLLASGK